MSKRLIKYPVIIILILFAVLTGCKDTWDDHYKAEDDRVDMELWEAIKEEERFSVFVQQMESLSLDSVFEQGMSHTLFIPSSDALNDLLDTAHNPKQTLLYHISPTLFLAGNVSAERRLQTLTGKYLLFRNQGGEFTMDDLPLTFASPLYLDGKYYEIDGVASPRPNLYEYTALYSQFLQTYIDSRDSVFLDLNQSTPIGFDPDGNTVYDSVFGMVNMFEYEFFPISEEFRDRNATFILFTQDQYISALDEMADKTGMAGGREGIPEQWQLEELMPRLMGSAMFEGMLEYSDLMVGRLESITGDSVDVDYGNIDPDSRYLCSNGLTYLYRDFSIDSSIYLNGVQVEGESLIDTLGIGSWTWKDDVIAKGYITSPLEVESVNASGGSSLNASFSRGYTGEFSLQFNLKNILPMRYRLEWRANFRPSGEFAIYVNDEPVGEFDSFKFRSTVLSVTGEYFRPKEGFNSKDFWVENLTEFGDVEIRFEYLGPGSQQNNGLNIDYVKLIPVI